MVEFNMKMVEDENDIPFITVIERFKTNKLDLDTIRTCVKKTDTKVFKYFKNHGSIALYRKFIEVFQKYYKIGGLIKNDWPYLMILKKAKPLILTPPIINTTHIDEDLHALFCDCNDCNPEIHEYDYNCDCDYCTETRNEYEAEEDDPNF